MPRSLNGVSASWMPICLAIFFLISLPAQALAKDDADPLIIGVESNDYYPHYQLRNGEIQGFVKDLFARFSQDTGQAVQLRSIPLRRLLIELRRNRVHFKYPDNPKWNSQEKGEDFTHSQPIVRYIDGTLVLPDHLGEPPQDLKTLGTLVGFTPWPYNDRIEEGDLFIYQGTTLEGVIRRTIRNETGGIYANIDVARYLMTHVMGLPDVVVFDPARPHTVSYYATSTVHQTEMLEKFNSWLSRSETFRRNLETKYQVGEFGILKDHKLLN